MNNKHERELAGKVHKLTLREQFRDYKLPAVDRAPARE